MGNATGYKPHGTARGQAHSWREKFGRHTCLMYSMEKTTGHCMSNFESWMRERGLSESTVKKYAGAISGPLTSWANTNAIFTGPLLAVTDSVEFSSLATAIQLLPIFQERNTTGNHMYSSALVKFAEYLRFGPSDTAHSLAFSTATSPSLFPVNAWAPTALRMVKTAQQTTNAANGQTVLQTIKNKNNAFASQDEFARYVEALVEHQHGCCAISGLPIQPDSLQDGDDEMKASLDRIDSSGHYEAGNLQVVCRFINRWKGADQNAQFVRLMDTLRKHWQPGLLEKTI